MQDFDFYNSEDDFSDNYPDFFLEWDETVNTGKKPGFYEPEELIEIIELYILNNDINKAKQAINYALQIYSDNEEIIYEILLLLNDFEQWNDLLSICDQYKNNSDVWIDGHRLTALLHLGMEDEAFLFFRKLLTKHADNKDDLSICYQAMGEALGEVDLFDSSNDVIQEAIDTLKLDLNFYWIQMQNFVALNDKEKVLELSDVLLKIDPLDPEIWYRLGISFLEVGEIEKAIDAFENAQSLEYDPELVLKYLIFIYEKNKNFSKALEKANEFLDLFPGNYVITMYAAKLNSHVKNWKNALKHIEEVIKITPFIESLYLYKSTFLLRMEEYKKAKLTLIEGMKNTKDSKGYLSKKLSKLNKKYPDC